MREELLSPKRDSSNTRTDSEFRYFMDTIASIRDTPIKVDKEMRCSPDDIADASMHHYASRRSFGACRCCPDAVASPATSRLDGEIDCQYVCNSRVAGATKSICPSFRTGRTQVFAQYRLPSQFYCAIDTVFRSRSAAKQLPHTSRKWMSYSCHSSHLMTIGNRIGMGGGFLRS